MKHTAIVVLALFCCLLANAQQPGDEAAIRRVLKAQTEAWNRGDLQGFMLGYWRSDSLLFVGKSGPTYGFETTLRNYQKGYPDTAHMGKLAFDILQVKPLCTDYYFVLGKWQLKRSVGDVAGYFTLLFRRFKGQWLVVADHSS